MRLNQHYPSKIAGYMPDVFSTLSSLNCDLLHHKKMDLNHPADVFLFAFSDFIDTTNKLISRLELETSYFKNNKNLSENINDIKYDIFNMYFYGSNFIDACKSIIKSLFEDGGKNQTFTKIVREFDGAIVEYKEHVSKIINMIKHKNRRMIAFPYHWDSNLIIGYFIEGLAEQDAIGPDSSIHKKYNDMHTAFSLNWGIPFNIAGVYFCSQYLNSIITNNIKSTSENIVDFNGDNILKLLTSSSKINKLYFTDEFTKSVANITSKENSFLIEYPSKIKAENKHHFIAKINIHTQIGAKNRKIILPYLK